MLKFENGDVLLTADEYKNLMLKNGNASTFDLLNYTKKYIDFYYNLEHTRLKRLSIAAIDYINKEPEFENNYYIREKEYKTFIEWRKIIAEFKP